MKNIVCIRVFYIILIVFGIQYSSCAHEVISQYSSCNKIVASVNGIAITDYDVLNRKKMISIMGSLKSDQKQFIDQIVLNNLIENLLWFSVADRFKLNISENEIDTHIAALEAKDPNILKIKNSADVGVIKSFKNQLKSEVIADRLLRDLRSDIKVASDEAEYLMHNVPEFDGYNISFKIIKALKHDKRSLKNMLYLSKQKRINCLNADRMYKRIADISNIDSDIKSINPSIYKIIRDIDINKNSGVVEFEDSYCVFMMCSKNYHNNNNLGPNLNSAVEYIAGLVLNKEIRTKYLMFLNNLRRTAYIKYFDLTR